MLVHSFSRYFLSAYHEPGTVVGTADFAVSKTKSFLSWTLHSSWRSQAASEMGASAMENRKDCGWRCYVVLGAQGSGKVWYNKVRADRRPKVREPMWAVGDLWKLEPELRREGGKGRRKNFCTTGQGMKRPGILPWLITCCANTGFSSALKTSVKNLDNS